MDVEDAVEQRFRQTLEGMWKTGTVTGTFGTKVVVTVQGGSLTIPRLASYSPTAGDTVLIAATPIGWFVVGKPA